MKYKIGEFSRILGVSPDTLRYYDKCGLLLTDKNPQNKYRSFSKQDALDIWNLHMLRSMDMGISDISKLRKQGALEVQTKYLHQRETALKEEIEKLSAKRERLIQLTKLYDLIHAVGNVNINAAMSANYALYVLGENYPVSSQALAEIPQWLACLPFTYVAIEIPLKSLTGLEDKLSIRLGLGILEENLQKVDLVPSSEAAFYPQETTAQTTIRTRDVFDLSKKDLAPFYTFLSENRLRVTGPAAGRIICSTCHSENQEYIIALGAPVQEEKIYKNKHKDILTLELLQGL